ncbi:MAG: DUF1294 domain-containing protein [Bacillota bacterium]|jgi:uncharacterized membrane protein YsdA (DUF1294 family)
MQTVIIWFYVILNTAVFIVYGWDKLSAKRNWRRVPEHILLFMGLLGGAVGGLLGMLVWHHKTRKIKFWLVNILALPLHICLWYGIYSLAGGVM